MIKKIAIFEVRFSRGGDTKFTGQKTKATRIFRGKTCQNIPRATLSGRVMWRVIAATVGDAVRLTSRVGDQPVKKKTIKCCSFRGKRELKIHKVKHSSPMKFCLPVFTLSNGMIFVQTINAYLFLSPLTCVGRRRARYHG